MFFHSKECYLTWMQHTIRCDNENGKYNFRIEWGSRDRAVY